MSAPAAMRVALLTQQISPYHAARYRVARREFAELRVFSLMNSADFDELLSRVPDFDNVVRMFDGKSPYTRAVLTGALWSRLHEKLDECKPDVIVVARWPFSESLAAIAWARKTGARVRSDEHTSELQSHSDLVCRLLLAKKKSEVQCIST